MIVLTEKASDVCNGCWKSKLGNWFFFWHSVLTIFKYETNALRFFFLFLFIVVRTVGKVLWPRVRSPGSPGTGKDRCDDLKRTSSPRRSSCSPFTEPAKHTTHTPHGNTFTRWPSWPESHRARDCPFLLNLEGH